MVKKIILSFVLSSSIGWGDCSQPVNAINAGDRAACTGFLFTPAAEQQAEQYRDDATLYKNLSDKLQEKSQALEDENEILEKRLKLYMDSNADLSKQTASQNTTEGLYRLGYFVLGVAVTALAVRTVRP